MRAASGLRSGKVLNTYPEGQRSVDGQLKEFKEGAAILAWELKLPIVPVALDRTHRICPHKLSRLHLVKVKINFGEPIDAKEVAPDENDNQIVYEKVTAAVTERIRQMLDNGTWHD